MDLGARLPGIDDALLEDEDVTAAVDALVAEARSPAERFVVHARLAALFATASDPDGARSADPPSLLASTFSIQGLASELIFGPRRDVTCACGRYSGLRHCHAVCESCGVEVRTPRLRAWRFGHVSLRRAVVHPRWAAALAARWNIERSLVDALARDEEVPSTYEAWEARQKTFEAFADSSSVASKEEALRAGRLAVVPVLRPDAPASTLSWPPLRRAYEALVAANHDDEAPLLSASVMSSFTGSVATPMHTTGAPVSGIVAFGDAPAARAFFAALASPHVTAWMSRCSGDLHPMKKTRQTQVFAFTRTR